MKKIDFGQTLAVLANIGVILGIVFLAIEIRDSSNKASNEALQGTVAHFIDWHKQIAADPELARIYSEGRSDFNNLSKVDQMRFDASLRALFGSISLFIDSRSKLFESETPPLCERSAEGYLLELLGQPGFRQWLSAVDRRAIPKQIFAVMENLEQNCEVGAAGNE